MKFSKNVLVILLVFSTISLCLAKPRWIWKDEEEDENGGNDEVMTRETHKNNENLLKKWMKKYVPCAEAYCDWIRNTNADRIKNTKK